MYTHFVGYDFDIILEYREPLDSDVLPVSQDWCNLKTGEAFSNCKSNPVTWVRNPVLDVVCLGLTK